MWQGTGCSRCRSSGYAGRIVIFELLVPDADMLEAIARGDSLQSLRVRLADSGFHTLREDGWEKVAAGLTTPEEVLYAASQ